MAYGWFLRGEEGERGGNTASVLGYGAHRTTLPGAGNCGIKSQECPWDSQGPAIGVTSSCRELCLEPFPSYDTAKRAGQGNESLLGIKLPPSGGTNQPFPPRASDDGSISRANSTEISGEKTDSNNTSPFPPRASDDGSISRANSTEISGEKTDSNNTSPFPPRTTDDGSISCANSAGLPGEKTVTMAASAVRILPKIRGEDSDEGGISRVDSAGISAGMTEIKNRIRGGGGGDMAKGGRAEGGRKVPGKDDKDDVVEEDTQPMYVEGVLGAIKTTMHATHGYYMRMLCDPITLVMRAHILLTLVHFITGRN
eukprot:gene26128-11846_t